MRRTLLFAALVAVLLLAAGSVRAATGDELYRIHMTADGVKAWHADYLRVLPYTANTGWVDGDRCAYRAAYGFLTLNGEIKVRVTFVRVDAASSYVVVNDKWMLEGQRFYDGTLYTGPPVQGLQDCPEPGQAYEPWSGPWDLPTISFETVGTPTTPGQLLDVRPYPLLTLGAGITFRQTESTDQLVTVVAYKNGLPIVVVYYDVMSPDVVLVSDIG